MKLFIFLLRKKTTSYCSLAGNWKEQLGDLMLAIMLIFTGMALAVLNNFTIEHPHSHLHPSMLLRAVKITILLSPLLLKLFPSFSLKRTFIGAEYPLGKHMVAFLDLFAISLYRTRNAIYVLYLLCFSCIADNLGAHTIVILYLLLMTGFMLVENVVNAISWKKYFYLIVTLLSATIQYGLSNTIYAIPVSIATVLFQFTLYFYYYERNYEGHTLNVVKDRKTSRNLHWNILVNNRQAITVLMIGIGFKLLILSTFLFAKDRSLYMMMDRVPFLLCLIMPIILFSYVFNNIWGYFYEVALNNIIIQTSPKTYLNIYLGLLLPALLTDAILTFTFLAVAGVLEIKIIITYAVFCVFSIATGIISSLNKYTPVPTGFNFNQFRAKTSKRYNFLLIIPAMAAGIAYNYTPWFYALMSIILLGSICMWIYLSKNIYQYTLQFKKEFFS